MYETSAMRMKEVVLDLALKALCGHVEVVANGNFLSAESVILSSGLNIKKPTSPKANGFRIKQGKNPGEILIKTDAELRSFYTFEMTLTPDVEESWMQIYSGTKSGFLATGLESGERYHFRTAKMNKDGTSPWSNVLNAIVA